MAWASGRADQSLIGLLGTIQELEARRILSHLRKGMGILKVAAACKVGTGTVQRIKAEMEGARPFDGAGEAA